MILFHTSKIEGPILSFWSRYRYLCLWKSKSIWESGPYHRGKKISALVNDWENNIIYWEESKQSETLAGECNSFQTVNSWWVWGKQPSLTQKHFAIYTLIYVGKHYFQLLNWHKILTYIIMKTAFLENWHFNNTLNSPLLRFTSYTSKGSISRLFSELGKIWKCSLGYAKIPIFHISFMNLKNVGSIYSQRPRFQNPNFEKMDKLGKFMF